MASRPASRCSRNNPRREPHDATMIDVHLHVVPPRLPGVGPLHPLLDGPRGGRGRHAAPGDAASRHHGCFGHGLRQWSRRRSARHQRARLPSPAPCLASSPSASPIRLRSDPEHMHRVEKVVAAGQVARPESLPRLSALSPRLPGLPRLLRAGGTAQPAGGFSHGGHLFSLRPGAARRSRCWWTTWPWIIRGCVS